MSGKDLAGVILNNATLTSYTLLEDIIIRKKEYADDEVRYANLEGASLRGAQLKGANLYGSNLKDADLTGANIEAADLRAARLQGVDWAFVDLNNDTRLDGVAWGDYFVKTEVGPKPRFTSAMDAYRQLKEWYTQHGYNDVAGEFFYRQMEINRKSLKIFSKSRIKLEFTYWLFGHGERWWKILFWIEGFVLVFALIYYALGTLKPNTFLDCLYYSAVSFIAVGYGSWVKESTGWVRGLGVFETFLGFFMMTLLLVTFTRKMTR